MQTKLTLRLDKPLIENAKAWAEKKGVSLSHVVAMVFERITARNRKKEKLHPFMKKIIGVAGKGASRSLTDEDAKEEYYSYLEEKYK